MANELAPPPAGSPVTELKLDPRTSESVDSRIMARDWIQWFFALANRIGKTPSVLGSASLPPTTSGAIPPTAVPLPATGSGLYRLNYYARITVPGSVSSSLTVILRWVENGLPQGYQGPALTANNTSASQAWSQLIKADGGTPISYQTVYVSDAPNTMQYSLDVVVETVSA